MESQPQNPEFRINPENFHPWNQYQLLFKRLIKCVFHKGLVMGKPYFGAFKQQSHRSACTCLLNALSLLLALLKA